jgi:hypothetical protein
MNPSPFHTELMRLRASLSDAIEANQREADLLLKQIEKDRELLHAMNGSLGIMRAQSTGYGAMTDTIRSAIKLLDKTTFVADEVEGSLRANFPTVLTDKKKLRAALWNMVQRNEIKVVHKGNNRAPAEYALPSNDTIRVRRRPDTASMFEDLTKSNGQ